jgi:hypothetical protein
MGPPFRETNLSLANGWRFCRLPFNRSAGSDPRASGHATQIVECVLGEVMGVGQLRDMVTERVTEAARRGRRRSYERRCRLRLREGVTVGLRSSSFWQGEHICELGTQLGLDPRAKEVRPYNSKRTNDGTDRFDRIRTHWERWHLSGHWRSGARMSAAQLGEQTRDGGCSTPCQSCC